MPLIRMKPGSLRLCDESQEILSAENYAFLQKQILDGSGIVIDSGKQYLLEARLMPIVRREKLGHLRSVVPAASRAVRCRIAQRSRRSPDHK